MDVRYDVYYFFHPFPHKTIITIIHVSVHGHQTEERQFLQPMNAQSASPRWRNPCH